MIEEEDKAAVRFSEAPPLVTRIHYINDHLVSDDRFGYEPVAAPPTRVTYSTADGGTFHLI